MIEVEVSELSSGDVFNESGQGRYLRSMRMLRNFERNGPVRAEVHTGFACGVISPMPVSMSETLSFL